MIRQHFWIHTKLYNLHKSDKSHCIKAQCKNFKTGCGYLKNRKPLLLTDASLEDLITRGQGIIVRNNNVQNTNLHIQVVKRWTKILFLKIEAKCPMTVALLTVQVSLYLCSRIQWRNGSYPLENRKEPDHTRDHRQFSRTNAFESRTASNVKGISF